jgi:hypothetical protein
MLAKNVIGICKLAISAPFQKTALYAGIDEIVHLIKLEYSAFVSPPR